MKTFVKLFFALIESSSESVPLILMLHDAPNSAMRQALAKIAKLPPVKSKPVMIRVETLE